VPSPTNTQLACQNAVTAKKAHRRELRAAYPLLRRIIGLLTLLLPPCNFALAKDFEVMSSFSAITGLIFIFGTGTADHAIERLFFCRIGQRNEHPSPLQLQGRPSKAVDRRSWKPFLEATSNRALAASQCCSETNFTTGLSVISSFVRS
jgi:hypothetical protein